MGTAQCSVGFVFGQHWAGEPCFLIPGKRRRARISRVKTTPLHRTFASFADLPRQKLSFLFFSFPHTPWSFGLTPGGWWNQNPASQFTARLAKLLLGCWNKGQHRGNCHRPPLETELHNRRFHMLEIVANRKPLHTLTLAIPKHHLQHIESNDV